MFIVTAITVSCTPEQGDQLKYEPQIKREGLAYVLVKGGNHIVVLNLDNGDIGIIDPGKDAAAMALVREKQVLTVFSADGRGRDIYLKKRAKSEWMQLTKGVCGAASGAMDKIWLTDASSRKLLLYLHEKKQINDVLSLEHNSCGIFVDPKGPGLYLVDPKRSSITVVDTSKKNIVDTIDNAGNSIHNGAVGPGGSELWVAEGNELKDGKPYGVGYAKLTAVPGGINIIDLKTKTLKDFVFIGGNVMDVELSPDDRYAYVISSQMPEYDDATLSVVDTGTIRLRRSYQLCKSCHIPKGVQLPDQKAFVSVLEVDENAGPKSVEGLLDMPFRSGILEGSKIIRTKGVVGE